MENIADHLFDHRVTNLPPEVLADVLARLVWVMDDNGEAIGRALRQWFDSNDPERIEIALCFDEFFLFESREEMIRVFSRVSLAFPEFCARCEEVLRLWDTQNSQ